MREKLPQIILVILAILVVGNIVALDYLIFPRKSVAPPVTELVKVEEKNGTESGQKEILPLICSENCQQLIDQKISEAIIKIPTQKPGQSVTYLVPTSAQRLQPKVVYVSVLSEGTTSSLTWTNIDSSVFYFDLSDYPAAKEIRFVASLRSVNSSAQAAARLYDLTNNRGVDYSDLLTASSDLKQIESSGMTIWRGNNKYLVQLKSADGNEVQIKEAKLKISF